MSTAGWSGLLRGALDSAAATERLRQAVQLGYDVAPGIVVGCSITELDGARYSTPASSDRLAVDLDEAQYEAGRGPCMAAARDHQVHHLEDLRRAGQFDHFSSVAVDRGILSSLSLPLDGTYRPAALNFYATSPGIFDRPRPRRIAGLLARAVSARMLQSDSGSRTARPRGQLPAEARARADLLHRAQLQLVDEHGSTEQAFSVLAIRSREQQRSIFEVARDVVATTQPRA